MPEPERIPSIEALREYADQPERWQELHRHDLAQLAMLEALRFATGELDRGDVATQLYELMIERLTVEERVALLQSVAAAIFESHGPASGLLPFLLSDPAHKVISTAALEYALLAPVEDDDLLSGPRGLLNFARLVAREPERCAALLAGLVILGDRRILPLLHGSWELLGGDAEATRSLVNARTHWQSAAQIEFLLDWLEAMLIAEDEGTFGIVAAGLYNIAKRGVEVEDAERVFPIWSTTGEQTVYLAQWSFEEYARVIEPRLRDISERESDPKIIPVVLEAWGLGP